MTLQDFVGQKRGIFVEYRTGEFVINLAPDSAIQGMALSRPKGSDDPFDLGYVSEDGSSVLIPNAQWLRVFYWFEGTLMERDYLGFTRCADVKLLSYIAIEWNPLYPV